jgi:hypothetical protein
LRNRGAHHGSDVNNYTVRLRSSSSKGWKTPTPPAWRKYLFAFFAFECPTPETCARPPSPLFAD